jgi:asparagine synthase (glutamine-hydrolysing)
LGVKPFFYSHLGSSVIFGNTLNCIRQHPGVSDQLNDLAIADFLLFDLNQDPTTTSFADIQRLPPAHRAIWSEAGLRISQYWTLPVDEPLYYRRASDYVERFGELLNTAVDDRLRTNRVGVFMSGGLDSPTLAATACRILRQRSADCAVHAFTTVWDGFDSDERYYSGLVASFLGIPIHYRDLGEKLAQGLWSWAAWHTPEPSGNGMNPNADGAYYQSLCPLTRVCFFGEGPDNALHYEWQPYLSHLVCQRRFGRLLYDVASHVVRHKRIPLLASLPRFLRQRFRGRDLSVQQFPDWLDGSFEARLKLRARWEERARHLPPPSPHSVRPTAYRSFSGALWEPLFREFDAGETLAPLEVRHPFVDLRLLRYMLSVPTIPWCRAKYLMRCAMQGVLPDPVLRRKKTALISEPNWESARRSTAPPFVPAPSLYKYVCPERMPRKASKDAVSFLADFRPYSLNCWLQNLQRMAHNIPKDVSHEFIGETGS